MHFYLTNRAHHRTLRKRKNHLTLLTMSPTMWRLTPDCHHPRGSHSKRASCVPGLLGRCDGESGGPSSDACLYQQSRGGWGQRAGTKWHNSKWPCSFIAKVFGIAINIQCKYLSSNWDRLHTVVIQFLYVDYLCVVKCWSATVTSRLHMPIHLLQCK